MSGRSVCPSLLLCLSLCVCPLLPSISVPLSICLPPPPLIPSWCSGGFPAQVMMGTYVYDQCWVTVLQSAPEPQEVLVAPAHLVFAGVKLTPRGLERDKSNILTLSKRHTGTTDDVIWKRRCEETLCVPMSVSKQKRHFLRAAEGQEDVFMSWRTSWAQIVDA